LTGFPGLNLVNPVILSENFVAFVPFVVKNVGCGIMDDP
jgi:hypothetical protein